MCIRNPKPSGPRKKKLVTIRQICTERNTAQHTAREVASCVAPPGIARGALPGGGTYLKLQDLCRVKVQQIHGRQTEVAG
jgi:hypothetical protein